MKKKISVYGMTAFYLLAGFNHFRSPESYYAIIPPWLGNLQLINSLAGVAEISLALLLVFNITRRWACYGIIFMLIAFIPSHIYMLQKGFEINDHDVPAWILWVRLIIFQPLFIWWAWANRYLKSDT
jgi:uncharacterized membrane protein